MAQHDKWVLYKHHNWQPFDLRADEEKNTEKHTHPANQNRKIQPFMLPNGRLINSNHFARKLCGFIYSIRLDSIRFRTRDLFNRIFCLRNVDAFIP